MLGTINSVNDLLGNLLNWSYLQRDNINIHIKEIEISDLADKCIKLYEGAAQNKNIVLMNTIPVNMTVKADNNLMQVVIRNLLNNAIKFSNVNSKVSVKFENNTLSVEDEGAGISSDAIKQILNGKFNSDNGSEGAGTGLGLNLVYSCIKAQNLNWDIYCEQGAGTIVKIFFN